MNVSDWKPVGHADPARLAEARAQLVSVAQWLARVERSFVEGGSGEELSLLWGDDRNVIATRRFASEIGVELEIDDLVMRFTEQGQPSDHEIDVEEHSPAHVEAWILIELLHRGLDRERFSKELPYDVSALMNGDAVEFSPDSYEEELRTLGAWFRNAVGALRAACGNGAAAIRVSPRDLRLEAFHDGRTLGFSPGDNSVPEPYFYVRGQAKEPSATLRASQLPEHGAHDQIVRFLASGGEPTRH